MADRVNVHHAELLAALQAINTSIQKLSTYLDGSANYSLGQGSVVEIAGASGAIGGVAVDIELQGSVTAASNVTGTVTDSFLVGSVSAVSSVVGNLVVPTNLVGSVSAISSATLAAMGDNREVLVGSVTAASSASGAMDTFNPAHNIAGSLGAVSSVVGNTTVSWNIGGSSSAVSFIPTVQLYINGVA